MPLKLAVENFGPIRQGEIELKPLTVFIGPNNSGKSYMALLLYTLLQAISGRLHRPFGDAYAATWDGDWDSLIEALQPARKGSRKPIRISDLAPESQEMLLHELDRHRSAVDDTLADAFRDYFGCEDLADLTRAPDGSGGTTVDLLDPQGSKRLLRFRLSPVQDQPSTDWAQPDFASTPIDPRNIEVMDRGQVFHTGYRFVEFVEQLWRRWLQERGVPRGNTYYLPSARSAILLGSQVLAAVALQNVRSRFALERIEMPALTGVTGDFLQLLWGQLPPRRGSSPDELRPALQILNEDMFHGEVALERHTAERPLLLYRTRGTELPLHRTSSMVAELAPLDLWIKHLLRPGDMLIIDEPEAHLHPANQRNVARVLIRLARAGVRVICPTHSSLILHQISNHILASEADPKLRKELGFNEHDLLKPQDVGVYLFDLQEDGTMVSPVPIEPGFGISEDEFVRVAEAIGDETYRLAAASPAKPRR